MNLNLIIQQVFEEQIKSYSAKRATNSQNNEENISQRTDQSLFIAPYIDGKFSEDMMKQQIEAMLNGGFETTGKAINFAILMLAIHPNIQEQVFDELRSVFSSQNEETTLEHIKKLYLLERVIKESMRLCPVAPFIERITSAEVPISNCILPKDTYVSISFFTLHRV